MLLPKSEQRYTYEEYLKWPEEERWELIEGIAYMQAAPSWQHQAISRELIIQFGNYLRGKSCSVFSSPFDLVLTSDENEKESKNVFQPDLLIVCDSSKLISTGYVGIPDLIVEIVSPSTARNDKFYKFNIYEKFGVKEYWIIEPDIKLLSVFTLSENKRYGRPEIYSELDKVKVHILENLEINLSDVFNY
ncbi:hypothetical protein A500_03046 [Clostridium sartagoforme AAU1]|uniref:Putative restriction endonuclease domain-containing protein n=1 Tax=Clostridium sartagoforme AAU1 TaxID=1202534 RepID=R9CEH8_9CLOT|nr:Uma2 family endonuclease [Clostridium sartagoforme]EOR27754.1 hypothetical protein A500_03046 [Clostridium sartagoforme AAU1]